MISIFQKVLGWMKGLGRGALAIPAIAVLKIYLKKLTDEYGVLMDLHVDSDQKRITATFLPKGESEPIEITATYKIEESGSGLSMTIKSVKTSREWLTLLARDFLIPYTFEGVPYAAKVIL